MGHDLETNKQNAIEFYRTAYLGDPTRAVQDYAGSEYTQHNPLVGDGKQAFFRFDENGKIVEHWDSMQEIPDESKNGNPMY